MTCKAIKNLPITDSCIITPSLLKPDWTELSLREPYQDQETNQYIVVVPSDNPKQNNEEYREQLEEIKAIAVKTLFEMFGKVETAENLSIVFENTKVLDVFILTRPNIPCPEGFIAGLGMKVQVGINKDIFDSIPFGDYIPLPPASSEAIFSISEMEEEVQDISGVLTRIFSNPEEKQDFGLDIDLQEDVSLLGQIIPSIKNLFLSNNIVYDAKTEKTIIIGFDINNIPLYVLLDDGKDLLRLRCAFGAFSSLFNERLGVYLVNKRQITRKGNFGSSVKNILGTIKNLKIPSLQLDNPLVRGIITIERVRDEYDKDALKTEEEKEKEDLDFDDSQLAVRIRAEAIEFNLQQQIETNLAVIKQIKDLDSAFQFFLNRVDIRCKLAAAMKCLSVQLPLDLVKSELVKAYLAALDVDEFFEVSQEVGILMETYEDFVVLLRQDLEKCYTNLNVFDREDLKKQIELRTGKNIENEKDFQEIETNELLFSFGWRAKEIKERLYNDKKQELSNRLVELVGFDAFDNLNHNAGSGLTLATTAFDELSNLDICELFLNLPDLFTIRFPFRIPVFDIDGSIFTALLNGILEALTQALLEFVRSLILDLFRFCEEGGAFGIGNFLNGSTGFPDFGEFLGDQVKDALGSAAIAGLGFDPTNLTPGEFAENLLRRLNLFPDLALDDGGLGALGREVSDLFRVISGVLTPGELSALLLGNAPPETNRIVQCIIDGNYNTLSSALNNNGRFGRDFFAGLGKIIDRTKLLNEIRIFADTVNDRNLCDTDILSFRKDILSGKGITPEQIEEQIQKEQARKLKRFAELANILEDKDYIQKALPNIFGCDENGTPSLLNLNPPSQQRAMGQVIQAIWEPTEVSFNKETSNLQSALQEAVIKSKRVDKYKKEVIFVSADGSKKEVDLIINPEWTRLISQGMQDEIYDEDGELDEDKTFDEDRFVMIQENTSQSVVAGGLRESMRGFGGTRSNLTEISNGIRIKIEKSSENPFQNLSLSQQNQRFSPTAESLQSFAGSIAPNLRPNQNLELSQVFGSSIPRDAFVEYRYENSSQTDVDSFSLNGMSVLGVGSRCKETNFSFTSAEKIDSNILDFISENRITGDGFAGTRQQKLFSDFWRKKWVDTFGALSVGQKSYQVSQREFGGNKFFHFFNTILSVLGSEVAENSLFEREKFAKLPLPPPFDPKCDNHLLKIATIKEKIRQETLKNCNLESISPNTDPTSAKIGPFEEENVKSVVSTIIKLYIIEVWMKSLFVNSSFDVSEPEQLIKIFIQNEIERDLKEISVDFYKNITKIVKEMTGINEEKAAYIKMIENLLPETYKDLNKVVGNQGSSKDVLKVYVKEAIPVFEVWKDPVSLEEGNKVRFNSVRTRTSKVKDPISNVERVDSIITTLEPSDDKDLENKKAELFQPENGGFILERFARVVWKPGTSSIQDLTGIYDVCSLRELTEFHRDYGIQNHISSVRLGVRILHVLPVEQSHFVDEGFPYKSDFSDLLTDKRSQYSRAFIQKEQYIKAEKLPEGQETRRKMVRLFHSTPVVSFDKFSFDINQISPGTDFEEVWNNNKNFFVDCLIEQNEFRFMFDYIYPVKRIVNILTAYSFMYLSSKLEIDTLYDGTKIMLKRLFESIMNSGKYDYDPNILSIAGMNNNATPEETGIDLLGMILKTPPMILKGVTEQVDPNISIASKIKLAGLALGKDIPMGLISLGLLPMNVFMPPPFGIGIGPFLSPLGFAYLSLGLGGGLPDEDRIDAIRAGINPNDLKNKVKLDDDC